ncbi:MAG: hypothetical protein Q4E76_07005 [Tissierellia bacterium]|nr:hypothetical protein [Tissierellia bacterium]
MNFKKPIVCSLAGALLLSSLLPQVGYAVDQPDNGLMVPPPKVEEESSAPISYLEFKTIDAPETAAKGSKFTLKFHVLNSGSKDARNIVIRAKSGDTQGLIPKSASQVNARYYSPLQEEVYEFTFLVANEAESKNYPINLYIGYIDVSTGEFHELEQQVMVAAVDELVLGPDGKPLAPPSSGGPSGLEDLGGGGGMSTPVPITPFPESDLGSSLPLTPQGGGSSQPQGANTPKIIVTDYSHEPVQIQAGNPFTLRFSIQNTNRDKTVRNIRVSLTADPAQPVAVPSGGEGATAMGGGGSSAFIPVGSSNSFHLEKIKPRNIVDHEITLTTTPDLAAQTYTITVNFEYEDGDGNAYTSSEIIGIPVYQSSEITPGDVMVDEMGSVDVPANLSLEFYNTGKSTLQNVLVKTSGPFTADTSTYFIGNMAPGASESYDVSITPHNEGEQTGEVVISYDDASGNAQELRVPFTMEVAEGMAEEEMEAAQESPSRPGWMAPVGIGGLILLLAGAAAFVFFKKRKKKGDEESELKL